MSQPALPFISLGIIAFILVFWLYILLRFTIIRVYRTAKSSESKTGKMVTGKVTAYKTVGKPKANKWQKITIEVEFENFVGTPIKEELTFIDTKPYSMRYKEGNRIDLRVNPEGRVPVQPAGGQMQIGKPFLLISLGVIGGYVYGCYWLFQKLEAKVNGDFDQIPAVVNNSSIVEMAMITIGTLVFQLLIMRLVMGKILGKKSKISGSKLKYYGLRAVAEIDKYEDTGTLINNNPMVRFYYSFTTERGEVQKGMDKMIVGKLDIGQLPEMKEKNVMYLAEDPSTSKFEETLKGNMLSGCMNIIVLYIVFIMSAILVGNFISAVL
jgi:hypothetical protein